MKDQPAAEREMDGGPSWKLNAPSRLLHNQPGGGGEGEHNFFYWSQTFPLYNALPFVSAQ